MRGLRASPAVSFLLAAAAAAALVGGAYFWLVVASFRLPDAQARGCLPDGEGSWALGMYYGNTPFDLRPIELVSSRSASLPAFLPLLSLRGFLRRCWMLTAAVCVILVLVGWAGREEQRQRLRVAGGQPRAHLRVRHPRRLPQQLRRRPLPLPAGEPRALHSFCLTLYYFGLHALYYTCAAVSWCTGVS
jgi:hypothetical protein